MSSDIKAMVDQIPDEYLPLLEAAVGYAEQIIVLKAENSRLREAIEKAPHGWQCDALTSWEQRPCDCWKLAALAGEESNG